MRRILPTLALLLTQACSEDTEPPAGPITSIPLDERAPSSGPRFQRLDPAVTGLDFRNELRRENVMPYVYSGSGVAIGDYDGDGLPDVYLVSQDGPNKLFRQVAPLRFEDVTESAGGLDGGDAWGSAATFADVDGDGDLDLYVCNTESPNLLYQNNGDGTFREYGGRFGLAITAASTGAAFADYDNDGDLDLYLLVNRALGPSLPRQIAEEMTYPAEIRKTVDQLLSPPYHVEGVEKPPGFDDFYFTFKGRIFNSGQRDRLLRNDGYANWRDVTDEAGIHGYGSGLSATWWDCDDDGFLDLYVGNDLESPDHLYRNRGDGTFEEITGTALPHVAYYGMGSDFGDIDNDGRLDFLISDMSSTTHYMSKMLMGGMGDKRWFLMNSDPQQYMRNAVFLNTGTNRFLEAAYLTGLASTDWTWAVRFVDLDEDTRLDFFATNGIPIFEDDPDAAARFKRLWDIGRRDEALDIARNFEPVKERNIARRNAGGYRFEDVGAEWGLDEEGVSQGAAFADLDRDGDLDLVVNTQNAPAGLYENRTAGTHRVLVRLHGTRSNAFGVGARIDLEAGGVTQTRLVVMTRGYMSAGEPVEHFGLGNADRIARLRVRWPSGHAQEFEDLEADRLYAIREPGGKAPRAAEPEPITTWFSQHDGIAVHHVERDFDDYAVQPLLPHRLSRLGPGIAWSDVDGDGLDDVWVGGAAGQPGSLAVARGDGSFAPIDGPWSGDSESEDMGAVFLDHDGDGDLDLYVVSGGIEAIERPELLRDRLYVNGGEAGFARAPEGTLPDLRISGSHVCGADFDRDGDLDLFVGGRLVPGRYPESPTSVLLRNDGGRFADVTAELAPRLQDAGMVTGGAWTDLDGDGWQDLVVAAQWQPVRVLRNDAGKALRDVTDDLDLGALRGLWNGVAAADLDGDGDMDLVAGNLGLNTKYKADPLHPMRIYADDFDGNGTLDVIEAKYEGDTLFPVRGKSCSSQAMPFLAEKFETYDAFSRATLPEIYGRDELERAVELSVNELRHLVLENRGDRFVAHPLPRIAQVSPAFGIGIADFDGDGVLDVALAQNSFSPEPETGRFDGGLGVVLAGRGGLTFEALPAWRSGVVMPEDAVGLSVVDLDGDAVPDFCCTTNNGPVRAFAGRRNEPQLVVGLEGPPGNPAAVGARLELVAPGGARQVREIPAGSGHLTQSPPRAFFGNVDEKSRLVVRWPDGETTEHGIETATGMLTVTR